jgi:hypothetical protein
LTLLKGVETGRLARPAGFNGCLRKAPVEGNPGAFAAIFVHSRFPEIESFGKMVNPSCGEGVGRRKKYLKWAPGWIRPGTLAR